MAIVGGRPNFSDGDVVSAGQLNDVAERAVQIDATADLVDGDHKGEVAFDPTLGHLLVWDGTGWADAVTAGEPHRATVQTFGVLGQLAAITSTTMGGCWTLADIHRAIDDGAL